MYKLLSPIRRLGQHRGKYLLFGLLLVLLILLNSTVQTLGAAAAAESARVTARYGASFLAFDLTLPHFDKGWFTDELPALPHVERVELQAFHCLNASLGVWIIGAEAEFLDAAPLAGRWYAADGECVVNEGYAAFLAEQYGFGGVGDRIVVRDDFCALLYERPSARSIRYYTRDMEREMTVVGIVTDDATPYHAASVYGNYRIYAPLAAAEYFFTGLSDGDDVARQYEYAPSRAVTYFNTSLGLTVPDADEMQLLMRTPESQIVPAEKQAGVRLSEDGSHWIFLEAGTKKERLLRAEALSLAQYAPTEGYAACVHIDSPQNADAFLDMACGAVDAETAEQFAHTVESFSHRKFVLGTRNLSTWTETRDGAEVVWYDLSARQGNLWYAAYLIADPASLVESLAPIAPLCDSIAKAATTATAVLILLMTILLVHDRQYEIGVLRCIGVTSGGVCGRFVAEILVFLVIVAALGLALAVPTARLAADYLGLGGALGGVLSTALPQLALIAAATVVSCVLAAVMILQKKPMEILNSRT